MARKKLTRKSAGQARKAGASKQSRSKKSAAKKRQASTKHLAVSVRDLQRKLEPLGIRRSTGTLSKWVKRTEFLSRWGRPSKENPVDAREVAKWAKGLRPNPADEAEPEPAPEPAGPGNAAELDGDPDDPYAPPPAQQLIKLRRNNPDAWAEVLRKMAVAERERVKIDVQRGKLIALEKHEEQLIKTASAVRTGLKRMAKSMRQLLADTDDPEHVEEMLTEAFQALCNEACGHGDDHGSGNHR